MRGYVFKINQAFTVWNTQNHLISFDLYIRHQDHLVYILFAYKAEITNAIILIYYNANEITIDLVTNLKTLTLHNATLYLHA